MTFSDNNRAPLVLDLGQLKSTDNREYSQDGLSRSSSCSLAALLNADSDTPISPLSVSPSPSTRADDMSEVSVLSPHTPLLAMTPPLVTPQKTLREFDSPTSLSPCTSTLSLDPFVQSPERPNDAMAPISKPNFRAKAKGLTFKIPSLPTPRSGQSISLLDSIRQRCDVSPLPSPLARDLRRRVEANDQDTQVEMDITSHEDDLSNPIRSLLHFDGEEPGQSPSKASCLGLDLGLPTPQTEGSSSDLSSYILGTANTRQESELFGNHRETEHVGAKIMRASLARSASAELVPSSNCSQARQTNLVPSFSAHENLSKLPSKKYPRKSIPHHPTLQSPFASVPAAEQNHSAYTLGLRSLPPSPEEAMSKRDGRTNNLRPSPSIGRFLSRSPLSPSPRRKPAQRAAHGQLNEADLRQLQMQGRVRFPNYFPEGYLLEPKFAQQYRIETELGAGGYGFVLSARNVYTDEQVAVKFINRHSVPVRGLIRDYKNDIVPLEAVVLQLAEHPGVVRFHGLYEDGVFFYLVQELHGSPWSKNTKNKHKSDQESADANDEQHAAQHPSPPSDATRSKPSSPYAPVHSSPLRPLVGSSSMPSIPTLGRIASPSFREDASAPFSPRGSLPLLSIRPHMPRRASYDLFECIEQHERLSEGQAKYIFAQVVETVRYLDSIGITHRDIKDENLVIDREFKVKFIDFGSAVIRDVRKPPPTYTSFFGTVTFASPEILKNLPYTAPPAEVWTLGILLSFLVTGQSPFPTTEHAVHASMCEPHESIVVSPACGDLMRKCLNPDPVRRYTIQQVREHPWLRGALDRA